MTVKLLAAVLPKVTADAPVKPVPVSVTVVPPPAEPLVGESPVTVGTATAVRVKAVFPANGSVESDESSRET